MARFSSLILVIFGFMFWLLRIVVAVTTQMNIDLVGVTTWNLTYEIILLFVTLFILMLIVRRKLFAGFLYVIAYGYFFGMDILNRFSTISMDNVTNLVVDVVGILISVITLIDLIADKAQKVNPKDSKTDWFFKNKDFDRKFDERADRNEYKF
ncbi:MAG: hypothetical protein IJV31_09945 [Clostridia bacterium]|nr:hypothetical protein [Clostridia bacterium]